MAGSKPLPTPSVPRNTERNLFLLALLHRLSILLVVLLTSLFVVPFDTSSFLQRLDRRTSLLSHLTTALVRWDSLHFLGLASPFVLPRGDQKASGGYRFEHSTAFQPGIVWLLRLTGMSGAAGDASRWDADVAVLVTSSLSVLAGAASVPLLYRLLLRHTSSHRLASLAAHLSILSPSPCSLVTPTPEPFYSLFVLIALLALAPSKGGERPGALRIAGASISLGLASAFRANGILNVGFVWWELLWAGAAKLRRSPSRLVASVLSVIPCTMAVLGPFPLTQFWTWRRFCSGAKAVGGATDPRPWCGDGGWSDLSPWLGAYGHVQREYWGVGLFSYWRPSQLPNFLLAAPVLYVLTKGLCTYLSSSWHVLRVRVLTPWIREPSSTPAGGGSKGDDAAPATMLLSAAHHPTLIPIFLHTAIQATLLLVHSHVQIALRFASPGGMPLFWALLAHTILVVREGAQREEARMAKALLWWLVLWNVTSAVLYGAFYPPA